MSERSQPCSNDGKQNKAILIPMETQVKQLNIPIVELEPKGTSRGRCHDAADDRKIQIAQQLKPIGGGGGSKQVRWIVNTVENGDSPNVVRIPRARMKCVQEFFFTFKFVFPQNMPIGRIFKQGLRESAQRDDSRLLDHWGTALDPIDFLSSRKRSQNRSISEWGNDLSESWNDAPDDDCPIQARNGFPHSSVYERYPDKGEGTAFVQRENSDSLLTLNSSTPCTSFIL